MWKLKILVSIILCFLAQEWDGYTYCESEEEKTNNKWLLWLGLGVVSLVILGIFFGCSGDEGFSLGEQWLDKLIWEEKIFIKTWNVSRYISSRTYLAPGIFVAEVEGAGKWVIVEPGWGLTMPMIRPGYQILREWTED